MGKNLANTLRRVAIGKEKPDGFAGTKIKCFILDFDPAGRTEMKPGHNAFQSDWLNQFRF